MHMNELIHDLISIIVPVYNVEPYLSRCIDSLINQDYKEIEIILIDDGSTDGSGDICDRYAAIDGRIRVIHQEYQGVSGARNSGLAIAQGEYIMFLDSDDEAHPQYVSKLYDTLIKNDLDIAQCCLIRVKNGMRVNEQEVRDGVRIFSGYDMQMKIFERNRYFSMVLCGKIFKTELFFGLQFPLGRINEDESLIYLLMYRSKRVGIIDDYLYYYHYNGESITEKKYNIHRLDSFYMLREKFAFYMEHGHTDLANKTANEYFSQMSVALLNGKREADDYPAILKKAKEIYREDRHNLLEKAHLRADKKLFMKLSYVSFCFVPLYGKLLRVILKHK